MEETWNKCTDEILSKLLVQEERMASIENSHKKVMEFEKKFKVLAAKFETTSRQLDDL